MEQKAMERPICTCTQIPYESPAHPSRAHPSPALTVSLLNRINSSQRRIRTRAGTSASIRRCRHCEAPLGAEAIQSPRRGLLDCFAAQRAPLAMTFEALISAPVLNSSQFRINSSQCRSPARCMRRSDFGGRRAGAAFTRPLPSTRRVHPPLRGCAPPLQGRPRPAATRRAPPW